MRATTSMADAIGATIVDSRRKDDYLKGHIPGAVSLPLKELIADETPAKVGEVASSAGVGTDNPVVVYDDTYGAIASRVAWTLELAGHPAVSLLDKTYSGGKKLGTQPVAGDEPAVTPARFEVKPNTAILAVLEDVEAHPEGTMLLDNRERLNFLESHIPNAVNVPYRMLADGDNVLRDKEELLRIFGNRSITPQSSVITYCGSAGTLSGLAYYALRSIGANPRLYSKSFREWKSRKRPTVKQEDATYWDLSGE